MVSSDFSRLDALGLAKLVRDGEVAPHELVEEAIARIEALNPRINAVPIKLYESARKLACTTLPDGPFHGIPFLAKDLATQWEGLPVTNASRYFRNSVARHDMEIVRRIKRAGIVVVGKSNSPENGWSLTTEPRLYGPTRNPWNEAHSAGGSSGGSAAAVAARMVPLADASDGAGSIRVPASNNGLVGLKPSRGRVTFGPQFADFWHGGSSFLCVSRSVRDTAAYLDVIGGSMPGDAYELPMPEGTYLRALGERPRRLRIGYTTVTPGGGPIHAENRAAVEGAARLCEDLGMRSRKCA